jgi:hypothetical protein
MRKIEKKLTPGRNFLTKKSKIRAEAIAPKTVPDE